MNAKTAFFSRQVSHDSPKVHWVGVKHETVENGIYVVKEKNSLSSFSYSPAYPPACVCVWPRGCGGETRVTCPSPRLATFAPTLATVGPRWRHSASWPQRSPHATRHDTWLHGGPRPVCHFGRAKGQWPAGLWFLPGHESQVRRAGTATGLDRVCLVCPNF